VPHSEQAPYASEKSFSAVFPHQQVDLEGALSDTIRDAQASLGQLTRILRRCSREPYQNLVLGLLDLYL
jgi:hypothetical protein